MKPLLPILLSLLLSISAFCQSAVDSFFNIKTQKPPENWVELIQGKDWVSYEYVLMRKKKVEEVYRYYCYGIHKIRFDSTMMFMQGSVSTPYFIHRHSISYYMPVPPGVKYRYHVDYRVINITDQYLTLLELPFKNGRIQFHFKMKMKPIAVFKKYQP